MGHEVPAERLGSQRPLHVSPPADLVSRHDVDGKGPARKGLASNDASPLTLLATFVLWLYDLPRVVRGTLTYREEVVLFWSAFLVWLMPTGYFFGFHFVSFGRPLDYAASLKQRYDALALGDLQAASAEVVNPNSLIWVIVGDREQIEQQVRDTGIAEVEIWTPDGPPTGG